MSRRASRRTGGSGGGSYQETMIVCRRSCGGSSAVVVGIRAGSGGDGRPAGWQTAAVASMGWLVDGGGGGKQTSGSNQLRWALVGLWVAVGTRRWVAAVSFCGRSRSWWCWWAAAAAIVALAVKCAGGRCFDGSGQTRGRQPRWSCWAVGRAVALLACWRVVAATAGGGQVDVEPR